MVDLLANLGSSEDNFAADEDQKDNLRSDHTIDETREEFWFIGTEVMMLAGKTFKTNRELDVARADNVLNLEVGELGIETELLNDSSIFARSQFRIILGLGPGDHHLAGSEDECSCLWFTDTHDDSGETLENN